MSAALVTGLALSGTAMAGDWQAVVVGQSSPVAPRAFGDAFHAAEALKSGGMRDVALLRNEPMSDVLAALDDVTDGQGAVVYLSGPLSPDGAGVELADGTLAFETVLARLQAAGVSNAALLVESCTQQDVAVKLPAPPDGMQILRAASAQPGATCGADTPRLTDALQRRVEAETTLPDLLSSVWMSSDLGKPPVVKAPPPKVSPIVSIVDTANTASLSPVRAVAESQAVITPVAFSAPAAQSAGQVVIFEATPQAQQVALPTDDNLPEPSIIVGIIEQATSAAFSSAEDLGDVTSNEIAFDDLDARQSLRSQDPELFEQLVQGGAFDPPEPLLARALQSELARMGCYTSGIDGIWGNGSRSSVERYFDEIEGSSAPGLDPSNELFRQIIVRDDVTCVVPTATVTPRATTTQTRSTGTRATTSTTQTQQPARTTPTQQQTGSSGRTISNSNRLGLGVIR